MRNNCQVCGGRTNCGRTKCFRHRKMTEEDRIFLTLPRDTRKFDPEPLKELVREKGQVKPVCDSAGINRRWYYRNHKLTYDTVDRICVALGVHPSVVYGREWWWTA